MARNFNGTTDYISAGAAGNLNYTTSFTFAAWIFPTTVSQFSAIVSHQTGSYYLRLNSANHLDFLRSQAADIVQGTATLAANVWRHVGFVVDSAGNVQLYADGATDGANTAAGLNAPTRALLLGSDDTPPNQPWPGNIAEAAIWNAALTANEMKALALGRLPFGVRPASLQWYPPLYGLQSPEPDLSGNALNGTLTGTAQANHAPVTLWMQGRTEVEPAAGAAFDLTPFIRRKRKRSPLTTKRRKRLYQLTLTPGAVMDSSLIRPRPRKKPRRPGRRNPRRAYILYPPTPWASYFAPRKRRRCLLSRRRRKAFRFDVYGRPTPVILGFIGGVWREPGIGREKLFQEPYRGRTFPEGGR